MRVRFLERALPATSTPSSSRRVAVLAGCLERAGGRWLARTVRAEGISATVRGGETSSFVAGAYFFRISLPFRVERKRYTSSPCWMMISCAPANISELVKVLKPFRPRPEDPDPACCRSSRPVAIRLRSASPIPPTPESVRSSVQSRHRTSTRMVLHHQSQMAPDRARDAEGNPAVRGRPRNRAAAEREVGEGRSEFTALARPAHRIAAVERPARRTRRRRSSRGTRPAPACLPAVASRPATRERYRRRILRADRPPCRR